MSPETLIARLRQAGQVDPKPRRFIIVSVTSWAGPPRDDPGAEAQTTLGITRKGIPEDPLPPRAAVLFLGSLQRKSSVPDRRTAPLLSED